ncbi:MAG: T9SS type A sorting domain-containing protein [Flavobacterium sp.]|nr:T9SS type A sorting domain-containing protein [Flavobacterium sp.]
MKKILLSISLLTCLFSNAQVIFTEDCTALTVGNVGTATNGTTPGQNGWFTLVNPAAVPAGQNSDFQVISTAAPHGNVFQINGSPSAATATTSQSRALFHDFTSDWAFRNAGNDIAILEYDFYTGPVSTSYNTLRTYIFDTNNIAVAGLYYAPGPISPSATPAVLTTGVIRGWAYVFNTANPPVAGYYTFKLGVDNSTTPATPVDVVLTPNTWYKVGVSYNFNTGLVSWKEANGLFNSDDTAFTPGEPLVDLTQFRYSVNSATGNTSAATAIIDNIVLRFDATDTLLGVNANTPFADNKLSVYPNPTVNTVNVTSTDGILTNVEISDINGRIVKNVNVDNVNEYQILVSELNTGVYMMKITSDKGTVTKKLVKE